jgi:DNA topoisomerase I
MRLKRVDTARPGLTRVRRGRGFSYLDAAGTRIDDEATISRIRELAIPPAWREVWISPLAAGHIQATGVDAAGRKQYLYHPDWRDQRDREKFASMLEFARALPDLRLAIAADLERPGVDRERVLAVAARLLDLGCFRIGGESYADENESYGLATLRKDHARVTATKAVFDFPAKSGRRRVQSIVDPAVIPVLRTLRRRRGGGEDLLAFKRGRRWVDVRSSDINEYIKAHTGESHSAKDFRTWNGTVAAALFVADAEPPTSKTAARRGVTSAVNQVAEYLGNTPAVCRRSYIDPRVLRRYEAGTTIAPAIAELGDRGAIRALENYEELGPLAAKGHIERAVLDLIERPQDGRLRAAA